MKLSVFEKLGEKHRTKCAAKFHSGEWLYVRFASFGGKSEPACVFSQLQNQD